MSYEQNYQIWKDSLKGTEYEAELNDLTKDEKDLADRFYRDMEFGTAGMRGVIGLGTNRMNIFTVRRATQALARYIKETGQEDKGVAIAYDTRLNSDVFARQTAGVLVANGIKVYMYTTPHSVPQLSFTILELGCIAGVVITASHNPPEYNGYKVYGADGGQVAVSISDQITGYIDEITDMFSIKPADFEDSDLYVPIGKDLDEIYYKKVEALTLNPQIVRDFAPNLNIVYTPLHGTGLTPVKRVLTDIGIENLRIVDAQAKPDPKFSTVIAPNPENRQSFDLAFELANKVDANMIMATDPDSDRLGVAVRKDDGEFIVLSGNQIGCLLMEYQLSQANLAEYKDNFVVKSLVSTQMADVIAEHYKVQMRSVYTGFKFIAQQIEIAQETGVGHFQFGFEESYGYLFGTFVRDKDAIQAAMKVAEATCFYASQGKTLYDVLIGLYEKYGWYMDDVVSNTLKGKEGIEKIQNAVETLRVNTPDHIGKYKVIAVTDYLRQKKTVLADGSVTEIDMEPMNVLYFELDDGRFVIRPSGTEPKLKTYYTVHSDSRDESEKKLEALKAGAKDLLDELLK